jgi:membrane protease YdiL (CAAX protease family)
LPLAEQAILVFLLLIGYASLGVAVNHQGNAIAAQGLPAREGWMREWSLGISIGWTAALVCVVALALFGGIAIDLTLTPSAWAWLAVDAVYFALLSLAEEVAFRGYAFQRFIRATGDYPAAFAFALLYAFAQSMIPGATRASAAVAFLFSFLLSVAYLRTRAIWLSWGLNFGWKAARALFFGLAVSGDASHSPVVRGDPMGSFWLTGAGFGLDGSWFACIVLLALLPVLYQATRDLDFRYNAPELIPAGIPVDLDAAARRQHEAAMSAATLAEPTAVPLVQIAPAIPPPQPDPVQPDPLQHDPDPESH